MGICFFKVLFVFGRGLGRWLGRVFGGEEFLVCIMCVINFVFSVFKFSIFWV